MLKYTDIAIGIDRICFLIIDNFIGQHDALSLHDFHMPFRHHGTSFLIVIEGICRNKRGRVVGRGFLFFLLCIAITGEGKHHR